MIKICDKHNEQMTLVGSKIRCRSCNREYQRKWRSKNIEVQQKRVRENNLRLKKRNADYILNYLIQHSCVSCGESDPIVLDFDHISYESKSDSISNLVRSCASLDKIKLEIEKCQILCANCHRKKTAIDFNWYKLKYSI